MIDKKLFKENNIKIKILIYILLFGILYGVCNTFVYDVSLTPFGIGVIFALMYAGFNGYILAIIYTAAYLLSALKLIAIINVANVILVLVLLQYLIYKKKLKLQKWHVFVCALIGQIVYVISHIGDTKNNLALLVSVVLGLIFLYCNLCFVNATIKRGLFTRLNLDEKICGGIILIIFMIGMAYTNISIINIGLILTSIIILIATYISSSSVTLILSVLMGLAFAVAKANPIYVSLFVIMAIVSLSFKCNFKYFSALSCVITFCLFCMFFDFGISYGEVISVGIGCVIFAFVPMKTLRFVSGIIDSKTNIIVKSVIDKGKNMIIDRLVDLGNVFAEMDNVYRKMVKGVLDDDKAKDMIKGELISNVCEGCVNKDRCHRGQNNFIDNSLDTIIAIAYEKGKVLLIDLPAYLTSNCMRINSLVAMLNNIIFSYKEYTTSVNNLDTSRILIAEQLSGVSKLLGSLANEVDTNISFDNTFQERIKEELSYKNIVCLECAVYDKDISDKRVNLIIKTDTINENNIVKILSKILNSRLMIDSIEESEIANASIVSLCVRPNYDIVFGSSTITKTGKKISGDSQSLIKLSDGKFMVSICDGMGSGKSAHDISKLTITLIEYFYRAGFENDIILSSVNKLLSLTEDENFSTIDLCIIDARKNLYDFIKLGATSGYLKRHRGECEEIQGSNLPVGVLEEIRPHITKRLINPFDMIVFVSDGITDSFENKCDLRTYISGLDIINPQTLSERILEKAIDLNGGIAIDDMTVICVRVFECV